MPDAQGVETIERDGLRVARVFHDFVEDEALPGSGVSSEAFWSGLAVLVDRFGPRNAELLDRRAELQAAIDDYHRARSGQPHDHDHYRAFLEEIGYLEPEGPPFAIETDRRRRRDRRRGRAAARGAGHERPLRPERRQRPMGFACTTRSTAPTRSAPGRRPGRTTPPAVPR